MSITIADVLNNIADPKKREAAKTWFASADPSTLSALLQAASKSERPNLHELLNNNHTMSFEVKQFMSAIRTQLRQWMIADSPVPNMSPASGALSIEITEDGKLVATFNGKWAPKKEQKKKDAAPVKAAAKDEVEYEDEYENEEDVDDDIDLDEEDED
jgi:hypothetical protein